MVKGIKLIGSKFSKISAFRNPEFDGKISLKTNIQIVDFEKIKDSKDSFKLSYKFIVDYSELGLIEISGILFFSGDQKIMKDLQKQWSDKKLETEEFLSITNLILQKASVKAFELEEELSLPIHIKLPSLTINSK